MIEREGAVPHPDPEDLDAGVAWHYSDPMREQRELAAGGALTDLSHRGMLTVSGPDRLSWLHSLSSQKLDDLQPGRSVEALILSPHGHVEHSLHVVDDGERTWLSLEPGAAEPVAQFLRGMRFRKKVDVEDVSAQWATLGMVLAPDAEAPFAIDASWAPSWQDPWPAIGADSGAYTTGESDQHPGWQRPWREIRVPRAEFAEVVAALPLAGSWAAEALRVAAWRPREGRENDNRLLPHEADWLRTGVHLEKGCYRGQETVARVYHLGRPPRRLAFVHLDGSTHDLPLSGAAVFRADVGSDAGSDVGSDAGPDVGKDVGKDMGRPVGHLTTVARHYELGPVGLALLKRSLDPHAPLLVSEIAATQEPIVVAGERSSP